MSDRGQARGPEGNGLADGGGPSMLPEPTRERWQPLRCGLVDVFHYDHEELWFHDGRLLLRGNNGTGKSKVLALVLPFLLDGEVSPHRVEPDGDPGKRMEWNLLLGGRYEERIGYVWLELGRLEGGRVRTRTLGCGMKAVEGRGAPDRWFFSTDLRIGCDLWLASATRTPLTRPRLAEALGERGRVVEQAGAWRRHVDEALFDLGAERYEALLRLLIGLRQPQLAKRPNAEALSAALSEALAPVDQALLADVAEAFRTLEAERAELAGLVEAREAVAAFTERYRHAAAVATRRRATEVRRAQSTYEDVARRRSTARDDLTSAERERTEALGRLDEVDAELERARARQRALADSPAMQDARALEREEEVARQGRAEAEAAQRRAAEAGERAEEGRAAQERAEAALAAAHADLEQAEALAADAALDCGLADEHTGAVADLGWAPSDEALAEARRTVERAASRRADALRRLEALDDAREEARTAEREASWRHDDAAGRAARAGEREEAALTTLAEASEALRAAVRRWASELVELAVGDVDGLDAALADWTTTLGDPDPLSTARQSGYRDGAATLATATAALEAERAGVSEARDALEEERASLTAGEDPGPPPPPARERDGRADRLGAPLWRVVDFEGHLDAAARAGLEAALEGAGLLDAWVTPDGALLDPESLDAVVTPGAPVASPLRGALAPTIDRPDEATTPLSDEAVAAVLDGIGLGPATGQTWVSPDGRYRVGALEGSWRKRTAEHIGHAARERARRDRVATIDAELTALAGRETELANRAAALAERRQRLEAESAAAPSLRGVLDAHGSLAATAAERREAEARLAEADAALATARAATGRATAALEEAARDLALPAARDERATLAEGLAAYREACGGLWPRARSHRSALAGREEARERRERVEADAAQRDAEASASAQRAGAAEERLATLRERIGGDVAALHESLDAVARSLEALAEDRKRAEERRIAAERDTARYAEQVRDLEERAAEASQARVEATATFQRFAATGLVATALPEADLPDPDGEPWAPDPTVRLARELDRRLDGVGAEQEVWERAQRDVSERFRALADTLSRHGHHAELEVRADAPVVAIAFRRRKARPDELVGELTEEIRDREELLTARERELLEEHLVAEVAAHLAERIRAADAQVDGINDALRRRPTSTGMTLRLRWQPRRDAPAGLPEARRRLLRQTAEAWSAEDRRAVGAFLQEQIAEVRAASEGGTWLEHLSTALDYRAWHEVVVERRRDGDWQPATGPASGGERALAVTIPMLAAAASFYDTAGASEAPRPIMLDEAFAGIDDDARAKGFGLLAEFDLDLMATSEREWGCYPTVPGLAIAQLARREGIDAVHVAQWRWDGRERARLDVDRAPLTPPGS